MREINREVPFQKTITENETMNRERIKSYTVDVDNRQINVEVVLFSDTSSFTKSENYTFFTIEYIGNPTVDDLWKLIDGKRKRGLM